MEAKEEFRKTLLSLFWSNKRRTFNQKSESRSHQLVIFSLTNEVERRHVRIPGIFKPNYNVFQPVCRWYGSCWQSTCSSVWENINRSAYVIGKSWFFPTSHEFAIKLRIKVNTEKLCPFSRWMRKKKLFSVRHHSTWFSDRSSGEVNKPIQSGFNFEILLQLDSTLAVVYKSSYFSFTNNNALFTIEPLVFPEVSSRRTVLKIECLVGAPCLVLHVWVVSSSTKETFPLQNVLRWF